MNLLPPSCTTPAARERQNGRGKAVQQVAGQDGEWPVHLLACLHSTLCANTSLCHNHSSSKASSASMRAPGAGAGRWAWEMLLASTWRKHILNWRWYVHHLREQHLHPRPLSLHAAGVEEQEASLEASLPLRQVCLSRTSRGPRRLGAARPHHLPGEPRQHDPTPLGPTLSNASGTSQHNGL